MLAARSGLGDAGRRVLRRVVLAGLTLGVAACANDYPPESVPPVPSESAAPEFHRPEATPHYAIAPGDSLQVTSYYHPELKQTVTIQPDGRTSLLLIGEVTAAGKTPPQLARELTRSYSRLLNDAEMTVTLSESAGLAVYVGGEVAKPTMLPLRGDLTLSQSIAEAGGFLGTANKEQVLIVRQMPDGRHRTLQANAEQVLRNEADDVYLRRHDVVYVPKSPIAKVDQFVDQYINQIIPHAVNTAFAFSYQLPSSSINSGTTIVSPAAR